MVTASIWLAWASVGWLANVAVHREGCHVPWMMLASGVCSTSAAILATIAVNQ